MGLRRAAALGLALLACLPGDGARAATAEELLAQLLLANDIAGLCSAWVQRKDGRTANALIVEGLLMIVNAHDDVTMADLAAAQHGASPERIRALKQAELARRGIDPGNHREVCFFARQIAGPTDPIGRYLEIR